MKLPFHPQFEEFSKQEIHINEACYHQRIILLAPTPRNTIINTEIIFSDNSSKKYLFFRIKEISDTLKPCQIFSLFVYFCFCFFNFLGILVKKSLHWAGKFFSLVIAIFIPRNYFLTEIQSKIKLKWSCVTSRPETKN